MKKIAFYLFLFSMTQAYGGDEFDFRMPCFEDSIFMTADFLYWKPVENGLDFAVLNDKPRFTINGSPTTRTGPVGSIEFTSYQWKPGFRWQVGGTYGHGLWESSLSYTFFFSKGNKDLSAPPAGFFLVGTFPENETTLGDVGLSEAKSRLAFHYHMFDLVTSRKFCLASPFTCSMEMGFKGGYLDRDWAMEYYDKGGTVNMTHSDWSFYGAGLSAGATGDLYLTHGLGLLGKFSVASLLGSHEYSQVSRIPLATDFPMTDINPTDLRYVNTLQFAGGISWGIISKNQTAFNLLLSYEMNMWFNLAEVYRFRKNSATMEMEPIYFTNVFGLQGLTAHVKVDF